MTEKNVTRKVTRRDIEAFEIEAGAAGDEEGARLARAALDGDRAARSLVEAFILDTRASRAAED